MGAQLSLLVQTSPSIAIFSYIDVLEDIHYINQLNSSRFLKTCKAIDANGEIIIKVFIKPTDNYSLQLIKNALTEEARLLAPLPNVLNYSNIIETNRAGYLIRQCVKNNLYDRVSSRPYLQGIELKFITFQLLKILQNIHELGIIHGDIKTENILTTSWNWLLLTDFSASLKPVYIPEDNPGEFSFYFDTSKRRTCYIAPERFDTKLYDPKNSLKHQLKPEMDVFSAGCCIAELYNEGTPIFNLSELFKYKNNEYDIREFLKTQIEDEELINLIMDMIDINPSKRLKIGELLEKYRGVFFPDYFYTFTYDYFRTLAMISTSTPRTGDICSNSGVKDQVNVMDICCENIYFNFQKICVSFGYELQAEVEHGIPKINFERYLIASLKISNLPPIPLIKFNQLSDVVKEECALLLISFLCHCLRNVVSLSVKTKCIELLIVFSQFVSDDNKINRVVPFLVACFSDDNINIQTLSINGLSQVLSVVEHVSLINENIFMDYIFPRLKKLLMVSKKHTYVRAVIANCLGDLVTTSNRFQELLFFNYSSNLEDNKQKRGMENIEITNNYSRKLTKQVEELCVALLTDNKKSVRFSLLCNILPLCKFFGREKTNDVILSHLITYLNDRDPALRIKLIQTISGIAVLLGPITLEQYILPLLIQTIYDTEELVVVSVLRSIRDLIDIGLIGKKYYFDLCSTISTLLLHPNTWIRQLSLLVIVKIAEKLSNAEAYCILYPIIRLFFEFDIEFTKDLLLSSCKQPVSRSVYRLLCSWSLRATKSLFWQQIPNKHVDAFGSNIISFTTKDYSIKNYGFKNSTKASNAVIISFDNQEIPLTAEDRNWIDRFKAIGFPKEELWKLAILRGYVLRTVKRESNALKSMDELETKNIISTTSLPNIRPYNIFFDVEYLDNKPDNMNMSRNLELPNGYSTLLSTTSNQSAVRDLNGSLVFKAKTTPTLTSNLENVYVQLEPSFDHNALYHEIPETTEPSARFSIRNSYEGDIHTIKTYLENFHISYSLKDYKEFGPHISSHNNRNILGKLNGRLMSNLIENENDSISSILVSNGTVPYLISGSSEGLIRLWDIKDIVMGEKFSSSLMLDCSSPITDLAFIPGHDCFAMSTKDGSIIIMRVFFQINENKCHFQTFKIIRKLSLNTETKEIALQIKIFVSDESPLLFVITNLSRILVINILTMEIIDTIEAPGIHGAICSFTVTDDQSTLIFGTSKGIVIVWDLRFHILINSFTFGNNAPISKLEIFKHAGKHAVLIVGGYSESFFSIWDFSKLQCQIAVIDSDEQPSIELFVAKDKGINKLPLNTKLPLSKVTTLYIEENRIAFAVRPGNNILLFDVDNISASKDLSNRTYQTRYKFLPYKATANLTFVLHTSKGVHHSSSMDDSCHYDTINSIVLCKTDGSNILISADNAGIINFLS
ncbi:hypothetical protein TBLA_0A06660 [Henningerozyma blattae CBS 6284]|uniref:non-specific serine/threonine protein kinase n=1 Tax=Henningerozyma blattae (strain ATCC 34711 / CBS 6284 / DSM 70876 / NBRC 10599 / NRRL Y-10934 / UCD 77-7) TaxID=1071380 RepID=I2GWF6_HENB6|nr:hypothetical protein TBLA_0A06660 [Tetrapisispora blattae CBS 6284]CCH58458.1 hypothetical protein TBLA_0A06660 [Tetrapisispora blattae CBS 6284]